MLNLEPETTTEEKKKERGQRPKASQLKRWKHQFRQSFDRWIVILSSACIRMRAREKLKQ